MAQFTTQMIVMGNDGITQTVNMRYEYVCAGRTTGREAFFEMCDSVRNEVSWGINALRNSFGNDKMPQQFDQCGMLATRAPLRLQAQSKCFTQLRNAKRE